MPGEKLLKKIKLTLAGYGMLRMFDGVLVSILKRLRSLKSVHLVIVHDWNFFAPDTEEEIDGPAYIVRHLLTLLKNELGHVKSITYDDVFSDLDNYEGLSPWMACELEKRNDSWLPLGPACRGFQRTTSTIWQLDPGVIKNITLLEEAFKTNENHVSVSYLEQKYGVF